MKISGNTILITGAGTGIGLEAAKAFDREGKHSHHGRPQSGAARSRGCEAEGRIPIRVPT